MPHLNGKPFIAEKEEGIKRTCSICRFRDYKTDYDCYYEEKGNEAKIAFNIPIDEFMPEQINNKEVGHYCPYWRSFEKN